MGCGCLPTVSTVHRHKRSGTALPFLRSSWVYEPADGEANAEGATCGTGPDCGPACGCQGCRVRWPGDRAADRAERSAGDPVRDSEEYDPTAEDGDGDPEYTPTMTRELWGRMSIEERRDYLSEIARNRRERDEMWARLARSGFSELTGYLRDNNRVRLRQIDRGADVEIARIRRGTSGERSTLDALEEADRYTDGSRGGSGGGGGGARRSSSKMGGGMIVAGLAALALFAGSK